MINLSCEMQSNKLFSVWSTESRYLLIYFISSSLHLEFHMRIVVLISDSQTVICKEILYLGRLEASANKYWMSWILKYVWYFCCQKVCIIHRIVGWSLWGVEKWRSGLGGMMELWTLCLNWIWWLQHFCCSIQMKCSNKRCFYRLS